MAWAKIRYKPYDAIKAAMKAYAEEIARETAEEGKRARKHLHSLKKKD